MAVSGKEYMQSPNGLFKGCILLCEILTFSLFASCEKSTAGRSSMLAVYITEFCICGIFYVLRICDTPSVYKWIYFQAVDYWSSCLFCILSVAVILYQLVLMNIVCNTELPSIIFAIITCCLFVLEIVFNSDEACGPRRAINPSNHQSPSRITDRARNTNIAYVHDVSNTFAERPNLNPGLQLARSIPPTYKNYLTTLDLRIEKNRLDTFRHWENPVVNITELAHSGLFYLGTLNKTQCISCSYIFRNWVPGENVNDEHRRLVPYCKMVRGTETTDVPLTFTRIQNSSLLTKEPTDPDFNKMMELSVVFPCLQPAFPGLRNTLTRLGTFGHWPGWTFASPPQLAKAGFFFTGAKDRVRCWYCNGVLENWHWYDEPWTKHAQWYPECDFILRTKGPEFVNRIQQDCPNNGRLISNAMQSPIVLQIQRLGYDKSTVERVVTSNLAAKKAEFKIATLLINAVEKDLTETCELFEKNYTPTTEEFVAEDEEDPPRCSNEAPESSPHTESVPNEEGEEGRHCVVCLDARPNTAFIPCGHICCCNECTAHVRRCPICRKSVDKSMLVYMS